MKCPFKDKFFDGWFALGLTVGGGGVLVGVLALEGFSGADLADLWGIDAAGVLIALIALGVAITTENRAGRNSKDTLRAYVNVKDAEFRMSRSNHQKAISVTLINSGQTPARKIRQSCRVACVPVDYRDPIPISQLDREGGFDIAASETHYIYPSDLSPVSLENTMKLSENECSYLIVGRVEYEDVFGRLHFTNYRLELTGRIGLGDEQVNGKPHIVGKFGCCNIGNESS